MRFGPKLLLSGGVIILLLPALIVLQRVPQPTSENTQVVSGILSSFQETETEDLAIHLEGDDNYYYVNRFRGVGLDLEQLQKSLSPGDKVSVTFIATTWSPLNPTGSTRPVAALAAGEQVFFDRVQR